MSSDWPNMGPGLDPNNDYYTNPNGGWATYWRNKEAEDNKKGNSHMLGALGAGLVGGYYAGRTVARNEQPVTYVTQNVVPLIETTDVPMTDITEISLIEDPTHVWSTGEPVGRLINLIRSAVRGEKGILVEWKDWDEKAVARFVPIVMASGVLTGKLV